MFVEFTDRLEMHSYKHDSNVIISVANNLGLPIYTHAVIYIRI